MNLFRIFVLALAVPCAALAQSFPTKPILGDVMRASGAKAQ